MSINTKVKVNVNSKEQEKIQAKINVKVIDKETNVNEKVDTKIQTNIISKVIPKGIPKDINKVQAKVITTVIENKGLEVKEIISEQYETFKTYLKEILKNIWNFVIPINELTQDYDYYQIIFITMVTIILIVFIFILLWFNNNEIVKKMNRKCYNDDIKEDKCNYNKKCVMTEIALGLELKDAIDKCI